MTAEKLLKNKYHGKESTVVCVNPVPMYFNVLRRAKKVPNTVSVIFLANFGPIGTYLQLVCAKELLLGLSSLFGLSSR